MRDSSGALFMTEERSHKKRERIARPGGTRPNKNKTQLAKGQKLTAKRSYKNEKSTFYRS